MKFHNKADQVDIKETVITDGVRVRGNISVEANIWLDGIVEGSVNTKGEVSLGANGRINGNVTGSIIMVGGIIRGNIKAGEKLIILAGGRVLGDVDTAGLAVEDGGMIIGQVKMPAPPPEESSESAKSE